MDRRTVYPGALPRVEDLMGFERDALYGLGYIAQAALGSSPVVDGLVAAQTAPASMNVSIGPGAIYSAQPVDAASFGTLPADANTIVKQGILPTAQTLTLTAPTTSGYSQTYLVQASYSDVDGGATVLPYYNSANPAQPLSGPNNSGQAQYTTRRGLLTISLKGGTSAPTGSQVPPAADSGAVALYTITISNSATTITSAMIQRVSGAPFVDLKLPQVRNAIFHQADNWLTAGGTGNAITLSPAPTFAALGDLVGVPLHFLAPSANTGPVTITVNAFPGVALTWPDGTPFANGDTSTGALMRVMYDGIAFRGGPLSISPRQVRTTLSWAAREMNYTAPGAYTYTVPSSNRGDGLTDILVEMQAAGGGGGCSGDGSGSGVAGNIGAGGGGGAWGKKAISGLTPGTTILVTLGAPGGGVTGAAGTAAASSSFGSFFTLGGGGAGGSGVNTRMIGGLAGGLVTGTVDVLCPGAPGGFTGPNSATITASDVITGYGSGGAAREGIAPGNATGAAGLGFGAGGGGASGGSGLKGGDGAPPKCTIRA